MLDDCCWLVELGPQLLPVIAKLVIAVLWDSWTGERFALLVNA